MVKLNENFFTEDADLDPDINYYSENDLKGIRERENKLKEESLDTLSESFDTDLHSRIQDTIKEVKDSFSTFRENCYILASLAEDAEYPDCDELTNDMESNDYWAQYSDELELLAEFLEGNSDEEEEL